MVTGTSGPQAVGPVLRGQMVVAVATSSSTQAQTQLVPDLTQEYFSAELQLSVGHLDASRQAKIARRLMNWR